LELSAHEPCAQRLHKEDGDNRLHQSQLQYAFYHIARRDYAHLNNRRIEVFADEQGNVAQQKQRAHPEWRPPCKPRVEPQQKAKQYVEKDEVYEHYRQHYQPVGLRIAFHDYVCLSGSLILDL